MAFVKPNGEFDNIINYYELWDLTFLSIYIGRLAAIYFWFDHVYLCETHQHACGMWIQSCAKRIGFRYLPKCCNEEYNEVTSSQFAPCWTSNIISLRIWHSTAATCQLWSTQRSSVIRLGNRIFLAIKMQIWCDPISYVNRVLAPPRQQPKWPAKQQSAFFFSRNSVVRS